MTQHSDDTDSTAAELWRWLLGGLVTGGVLLGLLIAAYAIGYHRAQHAGRPEARVAPPSTTTTGTATTPAAPPASPPRVPVTATPALIAEGKTLYTRDNCAGCHSLTGTAGAGPSFKGLAGGTTTLDDGTTVAVDDAYLERAITDPDAQIVKGYTAGLMSPATASFDLAQKPDDIRALVAFIKSQK
jgi:mono/diheme cytochrome c family protein